jgi:hypothetical protein
MASITEVISKYASANRSISQNNLSSCEEIRLPIHLNTKLPSSKWLSRVEYVKGRLSQAAAIITPLVISILAFLSTAKALLSIIPEGLSREAVGEVAAVVGVAVFIGVYRAIVDKADRVAKNYIFKSELLAKPELRGNYLQTGSLLSEIESKVRCSPNKEYTYSTLSETITFKLKSSSNMCGSGKYYVYRDLLIQIRSK